MTKNLKEQISIARAKLASLEAKAKTNEKKEDTRRKILLGSWLMAQANDFQYKGRPVNLNSDILPWLTRDSDKAIFTQSEPPEPGEPALEDLKSFWDGLEHTAKSGWDQDKIKPFLSTLSPDMIKEKMQEAVQKASGNDFNYLLKLLAQDK